MAAFQVSVHLCAGSMEEGYPLRFTLGGRELEVREHLDYWPGSGRQYFKLRAEDEGIYILSHEVDHGWELVFYDSNTQPERRLSST